MIANRLPLLGLVIVLVTAGSDMAMPQNFNSSLPLVLPSHPEAPVSPATPGTVAGTLTNETAGINPLTGLPCSGQGSLAVSGAGALADTASPPPGDVNEAAPGGQNTIAEPSVTSVFGNASGLGAC